MIETRQKFFHTIGNDGQIDIAGYATLVANRLEKEDNDA